MKRVYAHCAYCNRRYLYDPETAELYTAEKTPRHVTPFCLKCGYRFQRDAHNNLIWVPAWGRNRVAIYPPTPPPAHNDRVQAVSAN